MRILVIRFRQMGDAILATTLLNTLRATFPDAEIHFVLLQKFAPLFEGHPAIDRIVTFTDAERHAPITYLRKVWRIVHHVRYDAIIDMRSTVNSMLFALFSPATRFRIGVGKSYNRFVFNYRMPRCGAGSMIAHNVRLAEPLAVLRPLHRVSRFSLHITEEERSAFRNYMEQQGIDFRHPVALFSVVTRVASKMWNKNGFLDVGKRFVDAFPDVQIIFNYAPGVEEQQLKSLYTAGNSPRQAFLNVRATTPRELVAMCSNVNLFFGNEDGARHIAQAVGVPSLVVCAPSNCRTTWIPQNEVPAEAIDPHDFADPEAYARMTYEEQYNLVTPQIVWQRLEAFTRKHLYPDVQ